MALLVTATLVLGACAETVVEDPTARPDAGDASVPAPVITAPTGSTDELLAALAASMSGLGNEIIAEGRGDRDTLAQIDVTWEAVRPDIEASHPELVANFDTTIEMAHTAVTRIRPADADKAYRLLLGLLPRVQP